MQFDSNSITLAIAVLGAALGVLNFIRAVSRDKVQIKIKPSCYVMAPPGMEPIQGMAVDVINLGFIPVTISNAYVQMKDKSLMADTKITTNLGKGKIPVRLEARESTTFYFSPELNRDKRLLDAKCILVKTACGKKLKKSNRVFKSWVSSREESAK